MNRGGSAAGYPKPLTEEVAAIVRVKPAAVHSQRHRGEVPGSLGIRPHGRRLGDHVDSDNDGRLRNQGICSPAGGWCGHPAPPITLATYSDMM